MKLSRSPSTAVRGGFTLIELMVVIAIISILVALTAAAVIRVLVVGPRTQARVEIGQFEGSIEAFKAKYNVDGPPPSRIILRKFLSDYYNDPATRLSPKTQLDADSVQYLTTIFRGLLTTWQQRGINWHSSWTAINTSVSETLEGDQCLVFFLGGIQVTGPNGCVGFSTDNHNPDNLGGDRVSFYEFKSNRLVVIPQRPISVFFSYLDAYASNGKGMPYAYFSTYVTENNYNGYFKTYGNSDCATLGVWPYAEAGQPLPRYLRPKSFQIVSAGADRQFGPGTNFSLPAAQQYFWTSATANFIPTAGQDDQANFAPGLLSAGP